MDYYCLAFCWLCIATLLVLVPIIIALWMPDARRWIARRALKKMSAEDITDSLNDKAKREIAANTLHELGLKVAKR